VSAGCNTRFALRGTESSAVNWRETMSDSRFDNLARFLGGRPSRRQVLKGLLGGGALTAAAITLPFGEAAAQCVEDGQACSAGSDCCSGNCDATTGFCGVEGETTCLPDGQACSAAADCCTGNCDATTGYCGLPGETVCVPDGEACSSGSDCCTGNCDATTGYCGVPVEAAGGTTGTTGTTSLPASRSEARRV